MSFTVRELAELVQGEIHGDDKMVISGARPFPDARAGDITFIEKDKSTLTGCQASAAVVPKDAPTNGLTLIRVDDPLGAFVNIVRHLKGWQEQPVHGIDSQAIVHPSVQIGPDASILPLASIGEGTTIGARCRIHSGAIVGRNCRIGDDVVLFPHCVIYDGITIGQRVIIHANAVIGADGFGYRVQNGRHTKIPQLGTVEIGDDVEIGAGTTIDRGTFEATRIGEGTKIDNLVQIGHNCQIGKHNILVSQVGIAGSSTTGDYVVIAGQAGIVDLVNIGDGVTIGAKSGVSNDIAPGQRAFGIPATVEYDQKRILACTAKLPEMRRDIRRIKQHLGLKGSE